MRKRKYRKTAIEAYLWAEQDEKTHNYLAKLNCGLKGKQAVARNLWIYCDWAGKSPSDLIALKSGFESLDAEMLLERFISSSVDVPDSIKFRISVEVRGLYRVNFRALQPQAGRYEYTVKKIQRCLSKQQRFQIYNACYTPRDKFLVLAVFTTALAKESLCKLRFTNFESDWMQRDIPHIFCNSDMIKGHGKGRYRGVKQATFLTPEAKAALLEYRSWYTKVYGHIWRESDYVFQRLRGEANDPLEVGLAKTVAKLSRLSGVEFTLHDGRRILQTSLENVGASINWIRAIKGRKVSGSESPYSRPAIEQLREVYRKALPELEFLGAGYVGGDEFTVEEKHNIKRLLEALADGRLVLKD